MNETAKCREMRQERGDFKRYLHGHGIDIGAGPDPLLVEDGSVRAWDRGDGDAQLMRGVADAAYDFVYASHCLEHMRNVEEALTNWIRITKKGGFLYVTVPDYILYEKMTWPSQFNTDHKHSFSFLITRRMVGRSTHYHMEQDLIPLVQRLGCTVLKVEVEDNGFDYNKGGDQTMGVALSQLCLVAQKG